MMQLILLKVIRFLKKFQLNQAHKTLKILKDHSGEDQLWITFNYFVEINMEI